MTPDSQSTQPPTRPGELWAVLPAVPDSSPVARRLLAHWLESLDRDADERVELVLATDEAIANVIDHAYPPGAHAAGQARLYAWESHHDQEEQRRVVIVVTDSGRWKPVAADPGWRGRGLHVMRQCTADLHIESTPAGTTVIMTSRPVPSVVMPADSAPSSTGQLEVAFSTRLAQEPSGEA